MSSYCTCSQDQIKVAPIAVYTSGKGSSAAGLTASVQRDAVSVRMYLRFHGVCSHFYG